MKMDFTLYIYKEMLSALGKAGYEFLPFCEFVRGGTSGETDSDDGAKGERVVCLRHDVDLKPLNSLATARIEAGMGIRASYYFRAVPESWNEDVIREIASLGHEAGYHYESLTTCEGDVDLAYQDFCANLDRLRVLAPVSTICMHGSPRSPYDSKDIWKKYSYSSLGIVGEPYLDIDWAECFYLTDTGRRWDGYNVSVRDKIPVYQDLWNSQGLAFHSTGEIISRAGSLPSRIMITTHPQRWNDSAPAWLKEYILQGAKNIIKLWLVNRK